MVTLLQPLGVESWWWILVWCWLMFFMFLISLVILFQLHNSLKKAIVLWHVLTSLVWYRVYRNSMSLIGVDELRMEFIIISRVALPISLISEGMGSHTLWHWRIGHPSNHHLSLLPQISSSHLDSKFTSCDVCFCAKQTRSSFPTSDNKVIDIFEIIHCGIWGLYRIPSFSGAHYFLSIFYYFSRGVWVYLMSDKSEAKGYLIDFYTIVKTQFGKIFKYAWNGLEFIGGSMPKFYRENGILHQTSCVDTQQNGRVEGKHMHILNVACW